jgi:hypothetical protein
MVPPSTLVVVARSWVSTRLMRYRSSSVAPATPITTSAMATNASIAATSVTRSGSRRRLSQRCRHEVGVGGLACAARSGSAFTVAVIPAVITACSWSSTRAPTRFARLSHDRRRIILAAGEGRNRHPEGCAGGGALRRRSSSAGRTRRTRRCRLLRRSRTAIHGRESEPWKAHVPGSA